MGFPSNSISNLLRQSITHERRRRRTGHEGKRLETLILSVPVGVRLTKIDQAAKWFKRAGEAAARAHAIKGPCDFMGCYTPTGRMLVLDAKESGSPNHLVTNDDHLPEHQRAFLVDYGRAGAIAGLLALRTTDAKLFWFCWRLLSPRAPSLAWELALPLGWSGRAIDWREILTSEPLNEPHANTTAEGACRGWREAAQPGHVGGPGRTDLSERRQLLPHRHSG